MRDTALSMDWKRKLHRQEREIQIGRHTAEKTPLQDDVLPDSDPQKKKLPPELHLSLKTIYGSDETILE